MVCLLLVEYPQGRAMRTNGLRPIKKVARGRADPPEWVAAHCIAGLTRINEGVATSTEEEAVPAKPTPQSQGATVTRLNVGDFDRLFRLLLGIGLIALAVVGVIGA